jgi:hypothetical protein
MMQCQEQQVPHRASRPIRNDNESRLLLGENVRDLLGLFVGYRQDGMSGRIRNRRFHRGVEKRLRPGPFENRKTQKQITPRTRG